MRNRLVNVKVKWILVAAVEAGIILIQGCKRHTAPAPAKQIVRSIPKVAQPDIPGPLPVDNANQGPSLRRPPSKRHAQASQVQSLPTDVGEAASAAAAQRRQDASLLQQQEAASHAQQQELNEEVQRDRKVQEQMQDEPRIQDAPEPPGLVWTWAGRTQNPGCAGPYSTAAGTGTATHPGCTRSGTDAAPARRATNIRLEKIPDAPLSSASIQRKRQCLNYLGIRRVSADRSAKEISSEELPGRLHKTTRRCLPPETEPAQTPDFAAT